MVVAGGDRGPRGAGPDPGPHRSVGRGAVTQLPVAVVVSRPDAAVVLEGDGEPGARGDGLPVGGGADLGRRGAVGGGAVAQLAIAVLTPGPQGAVGANGHRVGAELGRRD